MNKTRIKWAVTFVESDGEETLFKECSSKIVAERNFDRAINSKERKGRPVALVEKTYEKEGGDWVWWVWSSSCFLEISS